MQAEGLQPDIYRFAGLHEYDELFFRRGGGMKHDKLEKRLPELVRSAVDELEHLGRTGNTGDGEDPDHYIGVDWREGTGLCDREVPVQSSGPARLLLYGASGLGKSFLALSLQCLERGGTGSPYDPADAIINDSVVQQVSSGILWNRVQCQCLRRTRGLARRNFLRFRLHLQLHLDPQRKFSLATPVTMISLWSEINMGSPSRTCS